MIYRLLADAVLVFHLSFFVFVVAGGLFLRRWPRLSWLPSLHLPAVFPAGHLCRWLQPRVADRPWPHRSVFGFLVHEGTQQKLGAGTDNRIRKGTPE